MADVDGRNGTAQPETVRARKRYCHPILRVGSTDTAINVTGLRYDPVQSTPAPERADDIARRRDAVEKANGHQP